MKLPSDLREFIELLNSHDVRYLIVGGYAVAFHGYPRTTGDIDFFVEVSEENAGKLIAVLGEFGFASLGLTRQDFLEPKTIVQLGHPPNRIDIVTLISGVRFEDAWQHRVSRLVEGLNLLVVDKPTLMANKAASGRPKELRSGRTLVIQGRPVDRRTIVAVARLDRRFSCVDRATA